MNSLAVFIIASVLVISALGQCGSNQLATSNGTCIFATSLNCTTFGPKGCTNCQFGFGKELNWSNTGLAACIPCSTSDCQSCSVFSVCDTCYDGYLLATNNTCIFEYSLSCGEFGQNGCEACESGFGLAENWENTGIVSCLPCSNSSCGSCSENYSLCDDSVSNSTNTTSNSTNTASNSTNTTSNGTHTTSNGTHTTLNSTNTTSNSPNTTSNSPNTASNSTNTTSNSTNTTSNSTITTSNSTITTSNSTNTTSNSTNITSNSTNTCSSMSWSMKPLCELNIWWGERKIWWNDLKGEENIWWGDLKSEESILWSDLKKWWSELEKMAMKKF